MTPNNWAKKEGSVALPFVPSRYASTWMQRMLLGAVIHGGHTEVTTTPGAAPRIGFDRAAVVAVRTTIPPEGAGQVLSSSASAVAPASAPASAAFWASPRPTHTTP